MANRRQKNFAWDSSDSGDDYDASDTSRLINGNVPTYRATEEEHIRNHEEGLNRLGQTIKRQKNIAHDLANEVDLHNEIIDNIETGMNNAVENVQKNTRNIKLVSKKSSTFFLWFLIIILAIAIVLLAIL